MSGMTIENHKKQHFKIKQEKINPRKKKPFGLSLQQQLALDSLLAPSLLAPSHPLRGNYDSDWFHSEILSTWKCCKGFHTTTQDLNFSLMIIQTPNPSVISLEPKPSLKHWTIRNPDKNKEMMQHLKMVYE